MCFMATHCNIPSKNHFILRIWQLCPPLLCLSSFFSVGIIMKWWNFPPHASTMLLYYGTYCAKEKERGLSYFQSLSASHTDSTVQVYNISSTLSTIAVVISHETIYCTVKTERKKLRVRIFCIAVPEKHQHRRKKIDITKKKSLTER